METNTDFSPISYAEAQARENLAIDACLARKRKVPADSWSLEKDFINSRMHEGSQIKIENYDCVRNKEFRIGYYAYQNLLKMPRSQDEKGGVEFLVATAGELGLYSGKPQFRNICIEASKKHRLGYFRNMDDILSARLGLLDQKIGETIYVASMPILDESGKPSIFKFERSEYGISWILNTDGNPGRKFSAEDKILFRFSKADAFVSPRKLKLILDMLQTLR